MKILIVRIGRMGDMVMVLPAIHAIRERYPDATLYALTSPDGSRLLPMAGIAPEHMCIYRSQLCYRWIDEMRVKRWLAAQDFDRVYCFEMKKRTVHWLPKTAHVMPRLSVIEHYARRCLQLVGVPKTVSQSCAYPRLPVSHNMAWLDTYGITSNTILIGFHPTYSGFGKWGRADEKKHRLWPLASFAALAKQWVVHAKQQGMDVRVVMSLLPHEQALGHQLVAMSEGSVVLLSELSGFSTYLAYLQRLNVLVVANTGVLHLAAALNTPIVALFSGYDPNDCGPYMARDRYRVLCAETMQNPALGLSAIPVDAVLQATLTVLEETSREKAHHPVGMAQI